MVFCWFGLSWGALASACAMDSSDDEGDTVALVDAVRQEVRLMRLVFECWSYFLVVLHGHRTVRFVVPLFR